MILREIHHVCSESSTYGVYSTVTFAISDGIPLRKKRPMWKLCSWIVDTRRSSVFPDCLKRVHCEILLPIILHLSSPQHQRQQRAPLSPILYPGVASSVSSYPYPIVLFCSALAALADSSISRRVRARTRGRKLNRR